MRKILIYIFMALTMLFASACSGANKQLTFVTSGDVPPFTYTKNSELVGIDVDIAKEIAKDLGVSASFKSMNFKMIFSAVNAGNGDVGMGNVTITDEREELVDFSLPYFTATQVAIVKLDSQIKTSADFAAKRIAVRNETTGSYYCSKNFPDAQIKEYYDFNAAFIALKKGEVDACVMDNTAAIVLLKNETNYVIIDEALTFEEYGFFVKVGNAELLANINKTLNRLMEEGKIDEFYDKHTNAE